MPEDIEAVGLELPLQQFQVSMEKYFHITELSAGIVIGLFAPVPIQEVAEGLAIPRPGFHPVDTADDLVELGAH